MLRSSHNYRGRGSSSGCLVGSSRCLTAEYLCSKQRGVRTSRDRGKWARGWERVLVQMTCEQRKNMHRRFERQHVLMKLVRAIEQTFIKSTAVLPVWKGAVKTRSTTSRTGATVSTRSSARRSLRKRWRKPPNAAAMDEENKQNESASAVPPTVSSTEMTQDPSSSSSGSCLQPSSSSTAGVAYPDKREQRTRSEESASGGIVHKIFARVQIGWWLRAPLIPICAWG